MHLYQMNEQDNNSDIQNLYNQIKQIDGINYHPSISQKELANHVKDSLLYVYPCVEEETSCICLMEAMASGCICLVNNIGALYETSAGYCDLFNSNNDDNIRNMADKIIILCQNNLKKFKNKLYIKLNLQISSIIGIEMLMNLLLGLTNILVINLNI